MLAGLAALVGLAGLLAPASLLCDVFVGFAASLGFGEVGFPCGEVGFL